MERGNRNTRIFLSNDNQSLEYSFKSDMCNLISGYSPLCLPVSRVPYIQIDDFIWATMNTKVAEGTSGISNAI